MYIFFLNIWYQDLVRPDQTKRDLRLTSFGDKSGTVLPNTSAPDFGKYTVNSHHQLAWAVSTRPNSMSEDRSFLWKTWVLIILGRKTRVSWSWRGKILLFL